MATIPKFTISAIPPQSRWSFGGFVVMAWILIHYLLPELQGIFVNYQALVSLIDSIEPIIALTLSYCLVSICILLLCNIRRRLRELGQDGLIDGLIIGFYLGVFLGAVLSTFFSLVVGFIIGLVVGFMIGLVVGFMIGLVVGIVGEYFDI